MAIEDLLNSTSMMPRDARIQMLVSQLGLNEADATKTISDLESIAEASPLVMLQQVEIGSGGQFLQFRMGPNYEMALLIAQITGSVLVTDSGSRWRELMSAQHRNKGIVSYPWNEVFCQFDALPIDEKFLDTYRKSQHHFATARTLLKTADQMVFHNSRDAAQLTRLAGQASELNKRLGEIAEPMVVKRLNILSPDGGYYDANVQRLLTRSSCLKYDHKVRSVYGLDLQS